MNRYHFFFCLFFLCLSHHSCQEVQTQNLASKLHNEEIKEVPPVLMDPLLASFVQQYASYFKKEFDRTDTPGAALAIVKDDKIVYLEGFGVQSNRTGKAIDTSTVFRIGSLSKGFAAGLTGMMVQQGRMNWNDPIHKWLPEFRLRSKKQAENMEVQHILSHTTGMPYHAFSNMIEEGHNIGVLINQCFPRQKIYAPVGESYAYQNAAYSLIQPVLEQVTGFEYPKLLNAEIFQKLEMRTASCNYEAFMATENKTVPHKRGQGGWIPQPVYDNYYNDYIAAGGVNASIADMSKWLRLMMGSQPDLLAQATLNQMFRPRISTGNERRVLPPLIAREDCYYGLGWRILNLEDDTLVYHGGYVNGYHSEIAFSKKDNIGICLLMNAKTELANYAVEQFFTMWKKGNQVL